jgi:hypothetical protein
VIQKLLDRWLGNCIRVIQEEDRDFLVGCAADVDRAMNSIGRFIPIDLARRRREVPTGAPITVFDHECGASEYDCDPVKGIPVPGSGLAGRKVLPPHECGIAMKQDVIEHMVQGPKNSCSAGATNGCR